MTHRMCRHCQPICRGLSHTMTFMQFVVGSIWFMLTYPVAEVALPVVISESTHKDYQVYICVRVHASICSITCRVF